VGFDSGRGVGFFRVRYGFVYSGNMSTVVLSVRVRRGLKEEAERLGIDVRKVVESSLEKGVSWGVSVDLGEVF